MTNDDSEDFVKQELRAGKRKQIEFQAIQGLVASGLAIGVAMYLRETISPIFQSAIYALLILFIICACIGVGAGIIVNRYH